MTTTAADRRAQVLEFLRRHDADTTPHIFGDLLTHLLGTEELVRAWDGSEPLALAALGQDVYKRQIQRGTGADDGSWR